MNGGIKTLELNHIYCGDSLEILKTFPGESVDCCVTSPPYYGLRDYGVAGQIGLEKIPEEYICRLVLVFHEVWRCLKNDGTLWVNIADSYAGSGMGAANYPKSTGEKQLTNSGSGSVKGRGGQTYGLKPKDLIGIPWMLAFALRADGWYLRQDIIWSKPNPMPESVTDRCTKSHEYIFLLSKSRYYYFDAAAIAEPVAETTVKRLSQNLNNQSGSSRVPGKSNGAMKAVAPRYGGKKYTENPNVFYRTKSGNAYEYHKKRNKRSVWNVATQKNKEAHFATFPEELIKPCIMSGSAEHGVILDPFIGSGTTGIVSKKLNRNFVGIDLNPDYCKLSADLTEPYINQQRLF